MFIAFASLSMPEDSLRRLIADVSQAGGMVVFCGFSGNGGRGFMAALRKVVDENAQAHISIDPRLLRAYHIEAVRLSTPPYQEAQTAERPQLLMPNRKLHINRYMLRWCKTRAGY